MSMEQVCGPGAVPGVPSVPGSGAEIGGGRGWGRDVHSSGLCGVFTGLCNLSTVNSGTFSSPHTGPCARKRTLPPSTLPWQSLIPAPTDSLVLNAPETEPCISCPSVSVTLQVSEACLL